MNALAHCVEAAWSPHRTPEAEAIAPGRRSHDPLVAAGGGRRPGERPRLGPPCSRAPRWRAAACSTPSMGVHHGLSQLVGGRTGIPHGLANAILLTHSIAFNAEAVPDEVGRLSAALGRRGGRRRRRAASGHRPARAAVGGRRRRGRPRRGGPPVAVERQRRPQPAAGVRGRRPGHPPSRLLTSLPWRGCAAALVLIVALAAPRAAATTTRKPRTTTTESTHHRGAPTDHHGADHHARAGAVGARPAGRRPRRGRLRGRARRRHRGGDRGARRPVARHRLGAQLQLLRHLPRRADPRRRVGRPGPPLHRRRDRPTAAASTSSPGG